MKLSFSILFFFVFTLAWSQENADNSRTKLIAGGTASINSNGIAPIPAFSLDKPAIFASLSLAKGRFSYDPTLAYGFDLKPWFIDNWLHYKFIARPTFEMRAGFNFSAFFSKYNLPEETILQVQRYFTTSLEAVYSFYTKSTMSFAYWNDRGQEPGTIKGHFLSITGERSDINIGKYFLVSASLQVFYINYTGNNDGLFITPKISSSVRNAPFSLYFQGIQALDSNISPFPKFKWNVGLAYTL
jgi:hypothetical protein